MRRLLMIPLIGGLLLTCLHADEKSQIAQIRKWYAEIEADKSLKKTSYKTGEEWEPHGGTLTRHVSKAGELRKLNMDAYGEHGYRTLTFYFNKGQVFFAYDATEEWRFMGEKQEDGGPEVVSIGRQYRYYFQDEKCIRALSKTARTKDGKKLRELMKKAKNEPMVHHDTAPKLLKQAVALSKVTSREGLEKYFDRP